METRPTWSQHATVTVRVPFAASSVALARRELRSWMVGQGYRRDLIEDARVVISELVGNSIRHAQPLADGTILITWCPEENGVRLSVTDGGSSSRPRTMHAPASALSGRGMAIVETLADEWWAERTRTRSTVHALLATV